MSDNQENWKFVTGTNQSYQISDLGNVKGKKKQLLKPTLKNIGYLKVGFSLGNRKIINRYIHHLVAQEFLNHNFSNKDFVINHINENKLDNRIQNLRILSRRENSLASKNEMKKRNKHGFKLNEKNVGEIKWLFEKSKMKKKEIAEIYNISLSHLYEIGGGNKWGHIEPKKPYFNDIKET